MARRWQLDSKKKELLRNAPWDDIYPKLVAYALWEAGRYSWRTDTLPKGHTPESIVQEAIEKTFSEDKNWDPERGDLLPWLKWVVKGDINRLYNSASLTKGIYVYGLESFEEADDVTLDKAEYKNNDYLPDEHIAKSPEDLVSATETEKENSFLTKLKIDALIESCDGRPELEEIVYTITGDKCSSDAQALAQYFGRPVEEIYQQLRALRRRAEKIIKKTDWMRNGQA